MLSCRDKERSSEHSALGIHIYATSRCQFRLFLHRLLNILFEFQSFEFPFTQWFKLGT